MTPDDTVLAIKPFGYMIETYVDAENMEFAEQTAYSVLDFFLTCLSYRSIMPISGARRHVIYDVTPEITSRAFKQYFYDFVTPHPEEKVDAGELTRLTEQIYESIRDNGNLARAFRWFRKGMLEDDQVDQFLFFWQGLETINKTVAIKLHVPTNASTTIKRMCPRCETEYQEEVSTKGGIEALYEYFNLDKSLRTKINRVRNGASHGFASMHDLWSQSFDLLPTIAMLLHGAIMLCLDQKPESNKLFGAVSPTKAGECIYLQGTLESEDLNHLGQGGYYPYFVHDVKQIVQEGRSIRNESNFTQHLACPFSATGMGVSGRGINVTIHEVR